MIRVGEHYFEFVENYNDAFNQEQFENRYSEILDRYPYIVGDIGFEQLRLRGFVEDRKKGSDINKRFSSIQDYLMEYCNFGCPYFVLRRLKQEEVVSLIGHEDIETAEFREIDADTDEVVDDLNLVTETEDDDIKHSDESINDEVNDDETIEKDPAGEVEEKVSQQTENNTELEKPEEIIAEKEVSSQTSAEKKTFNHYLK